MKRYSEHRLKYYLSFAEGWRHLVTVVYVNNANYYCSLSENS